MYSVLRDVFGYPAFRGGQEQAIGAVLDGRDALVLLPTGAGKSLCFQVPAIAQHRAGRGTTLVVSPLIALMIDQVAALTGRGIPAAAIHSQQDDDEQRAVVGQFVRGELALLYVSPERAALASFHRLVKRTPIALLAIDEAHCVSQWGHDFRPEYLQLGALRRLTDAPMIAVTATATPRVMTEIAGSLGLASPTIVRGDFARPNLQFAVHHAGAQAARIAATVAACEAAGLRSRHGAGRGIVYCSTRKTAQQVAQALVGAGFPAGYYHAGRTALARDRSQRSFAAGRTRVLVATSAFGMGIDHGDVRLIVHFHAPGSVEAYYQEAGRAGRDGEPSTCLLLYGPGDLVTQRRLAGDGPRTEAALAAIARYAESQRCRQQMLCAHFTGTDEHPTCGTCDACTGVVAARPEPIEYAALSDDARRTIVAALTAHGRPVGKGTLAKALRGSNAKPVALAGLTRLAEHGALAEVAEAALVAGIEQLVRERVLERRGRKFPTVMLRGATRPARAARTTRSGLAADLDRLRKQLARQLAWKTYMVFPRSVIAAIDKQRPATRADLANIRGLGPSKISRFGDELLAAVRRHA